MELYIYRCPDCGTIYDANVYANGDIKILYKGEWEEFCSHCGSVCQHIGIEEIEEWELE